MTRPEGFGRQVGVVLSGSGVGMVIMLLVTPILTRIYDVDDFGLLAAYLSAVLTVGAVAALRFELAIPLARTAAAAADLVWLCLVTVVGVSGVSRS